MQAIDLDYRSFVTWAAEEPSRDVKITIYDGDRADIFVGQWLNDDTGRRDYVCQFVGTVDEIDFVGKLARKREEGREYRRLEYERMKAEFE